MTEYERTHLLALALTPRVQGDGHTMCNVETAEAAAKLVQANYHLRGQMNIEKLDSVLCQDIKASAAGLQ